MRDDEPEIPSRRPFGYAAKDGDASRYPSTDTDAVTPHDCAASPQPESNSTNWHCPE